MARVLVTGASSGIGAAAAHAFALAGDDVLARLDAGIPPGQPCPAGTGIGSCAPEAERFAETFAKWASGDIGVNLYAGYAVPPHYDSLVAKLIVHGATRAEAIARCRRALTEMVVDGIHTTIPLHQLIMEDPEFASGDYTIHWLERFVARHTPAA